MWRFTVSLLQFAICSANCLCLFVILYAVWTHDKEAGAQRVTVTPGAGIHGQRLLPLTVGISVAWKKVELQTCCCYPSARFSLLCWASIVCVLLLFCTSVVLKMIIMLIFSVPFTSMAISPCYVFALPNPNPQSFPDLSQQVLVALISNK